MDLGELQFPERAARDALLARAVEHATEHGILVATADGKAATVAPTTILPTATPRACFEDVIGLQPAYNTLMDKIARDAGFLAAALDHTALVDPFTHRLKELYDLVAAEFPGRYQTEYAFGLMRNDFMIHCPEGTPFAEASLLQVENNTIAASFAMLSARVSDMHRHLLAAHPALLDALPANPAMERLPAGFMAAHTAYLSERPADCPDRPFAVVMVVQPGEVNSYDQRHLSDAIKARHGLPTVRLSLAEIEARCSVTPRGCLVLSPAPAPASDTGAAGGAEGGEEEVELSVVYYRAGYSPADYPSEREWDGRLRAERSRAVKCPNLAYHLAGSKKVQQVLAGPETLERYLPEGEAARVRATFAGLYSLDAAEYGSAAELEEVLARARRRPGDYVLKPQREGGGNNLYDTEMAEALTAMSPDELSGHILMERIHAPKLAGHLLVRGSELEETPVTTEIGIYGCIVGNGTDVPLNEMAGHLLRTKRAASKEAGVMAGLGLIDSPWLV